MENETDGQRHLYAYGGVPGFSGLNVIVGMPVADILAGWVRLAVVGLGVFAIVLGLTGLAVLLLLAQLRRRIASQRLSASLARYPLNNINPVMTVSSTGERLFMNDAARNSGDGGRGHRRGASAG